MKVWTNNNKTYFISFGALVGVVSKVTRKYPNHIPFESEVCISIGKVETSKNPVFDNQKTTSYIFFCFRLMVLDINNRRKDDE